MNVLRSVMSGQTSRQRRTRSSVFSACAGRRMSLRTRGLPCWNRHVEVRQHLAVGHQRNHVVHVRVRVDVVQAHPDAERAQCAREVDEPRLERLAAPEAGGIAQVRAVGARVLRDHEQFLRRRRCTSRSASTITSPIGRLARSPRIDGMMQKLQR